MPSHVHVLIVATSLSPRSRSQTLARLAAEKLAAGDTPHTLLDLRATPLPFTGSDEAWGDPAVAAIKAQTRAATHLIFAAPVYNYDVNAVAKNYIEHMGKDAFEGKTVALLLSAGGAGSYMAAMPFANSLMLDFRCWIVPRFLYVSKDLEGGRLPAELDGRLDGLLADLLSRDGPIR